MQSLLEETIDAAMELTDAEFGALGVVNDHGRIIEFHHRGMSPDAAESIGGPPVGRGLLGDITR
ncbi:MAG: histidine kinase, partial [Proteobacteria bacterium]|nr:histidine kinase [Pseudomonadota bacterium]